jgi:hypothetical protein
VESRITSYDTKKSKFFQLNADVIALIFDAIASLKDATSLCLTNTRMLRLGHRRVKALTKLSWSPWAGDRLIVVHNDSLQSRRSAEVFPPTLNADEISLIRRNGGLARHIEDFREFKNKPYMPSMREILSKPTQFKWATFGGISFADYPVAISWVICNISEREYVRLETITEHDSIIGNRLNFLAHLASSFNPYPLVGTLTRLMLGGVWAGDRIKITTLEKAEAEFEDWSKWRRLMEKSMGSMADS